MTIQPGSSTASASGTQALSPSMWRGDATTRHPLRALWVSAAVGMLLGSALLLGVGFAHPAWVHDAAHDVRHGAGFPCH